jgi:hypothetical protein
MTMEKTKTVREVAEVEAVKHVNPIKELFENICAQRNLDKTFADVLKELTA